MEATLILPNQLFESHPAIKKERPVWLVEEFLFFKFQRFHRQRLILLRAAMKEYEKYLKKKGFRTHYIESKELNKRGDLFALLSRQKITDLYLAEETDTKFNLDLEQAGKKNNWKLHILPSPMFLCSPEEIALFFKGKKRYSMAQFYAFQRKKLNLLMEEGKPIGGKFSFDTENRKRLPKGIRIPKHQLPRKTKEIEEAIRYVDHYFPNSAGVGTTLLYPPTFSGAKKLLSDFIEEKLAFFGDYEDAIAKDELFLFHSVLTPVLNIGLITPKQVVEKAMAACKKKKVPLNSIEGFLRQIIGWREFMRACYLMKGEEERSKNSLRHKNPLPKGFWDGTTGIDPIDTTIRKVLKTGYCHHIERLMILGNFLLLTETDPDAVYEWFMEHFVDAYDWVMVPNVYGMSQYADGGLITSKPYISGSNYLLKMSDYPKGAWTRIWDGLFWRFLLKNRDLISKNPRLKMLLGYLKKNRKEIDEKIAESSQKIKWLKS